MQRAHRTTAGAEWAPSRRAGFATKVASVVRTCHSVQSGACTKQPPCARCVWLSARAACARHITPCVRARCAFGSPPAHPLALLPATRKRRQHLGGQITPPAHGARRRARAGRSAPITTHTLGGSPLPARTGRCRARAGGRGRSRARGAHPRAHQKSSKIYNFFQTNPTHTHQHHPTPPKNHHHPPKSQKNHPKFTTNQHSAPRTAQFTQLRMGLKVSYATKRRHLTQLRTKA